MRNSCIRAVILLFLLLTGFAGAATPVFSQDSEESIRHLVQQPIALVQLMEVGVPREDVESIARTLNHGQLSPEEFNEIMQKIPAFAVEREGFSGVNSYLFSQLGEGITGRELAETVHTHLRSLGITTGNARASSLPLMASFLPRNISPEVERARELERQRMLRREEARGQQGGRTGPPPQPGTSGMGGAGPGGMQTPGAGLPR